MARFKNIRKWRAFGCGIPEKNPADRVPGTYRGHPLVVPLPDRFPLRFPIEFIVADIQAGTEDKCDTF